jgi:hypothetical protein
VAAEAKRIDGGNTEDGSYFVRQAVALAKPTELLIVTTEIDEEDAAATVGAPGGTGLSLREAIKIANNRPGRQAIGYYGAMSQRLMRGLPPLCDSAGVDLVADAFAQNVELDCSDVTGTEPCLTLCDNNFVAGLVLRGCAAEAIRYKGTNNQVTRCAIEDNGVGVSVRQRDNTVGPGNLIRSHGEIGFGVDVRANALVVDNTIVGHEVGVVLVNQSDGTRVIGNIVAKNRVGARLEGNAKDIVLAHNTFWSQRDVALGAAGSATGVVFFNNIVGYSGKTGIDLSVSSFNALNSNDFWHNEDGDLQPGDVLPPGNFALEPALAAPDLGDFALSPTSALGNAGMASDYDRNGPGPGLFNDAAPDIGALELP